jgi:hypothetical protein
MGLISKIGAMFRSDPAAAAADTTVSHALALVTKSIDPQLMSLPDAMEKLVPAVEFALDYYRRVVEQIPGPVSISTSTHGSDEILKTLFPAADEIGFGLGRSIAVRDSVNWFIERGHERVHAVMGARVRPHRENGNASFVDHTFRSLGADEQDTRECICAAAFTSLVKAYTDRMKDKQREWGLLHTEGRLQQELKSRSEGGDNGSVATQAADESFDHQIARAVQDTGSERALQVLIDWLHAPEQRLRLETGEGHPMVGPVGDNGKCQIQMPTLAGADRRKWLVCVVEFPLQEALDAIKRESQSHRYILI